MAGEERSGERPAYFLEAENIPEAFEKAMKKVWFDGVPIKTQYDKPGDPESKDAAVLIRVKNPFAQPRFHRTFADGIGGIAEYVQEVVNGAHDYWISSPENIIEEVKTGKKKDTKWSYTYHQRLFEAPNPIGEPENQIETMINNLAKDTYSRRANAVTWIQYIDGHLSDPPCLQRLWGRIFEDENGKKYLNFDSEWRSRDLKKAWFENAIAITTLQKRVAEAISEKRNEEILVGPYTDFSNSLHIYGSYFREMEGDPEKGVKTFFESLSSRPFSSDNALNATSRTYTSEQVRELFINDGCGKGLENMLKREKDMPEKARALVEKDLQRLKDGSYIP